MSSLYAIVLIVVERSEREFLPKLMWKYELDARGFLCVLVNRPFAKLALLVLNIINVKLIIIDKSCQSYHLKYLSKLKSKGNYLIVAEEEAWVPFDIDDFFTRRLPMQAKSIVDELWIPLNAPIKDYIPKGFKCYLIDHPRTLITHKEYEQKNKINNSKTRSSGVILFVSSFGLLSSDFEFIDVMENECHDIDIIKYKRIHNELLRRFDHFVEIINLLAERLPDAEIRVRQHPAEIGLWSKKRISSKVVFDEANYIESIAQSSIVIHSGSTVAFDVPEIYKTKLIYVAPIECEFNKFSKCASGHSIEEDVKSTVVQIDKIFRYNRNTKLNFQNNSTAKSITLIPGSEMLSKSNKLGFFKINLLHTIFRLMSFILSVSMPFLYKNNARELQKMISFSEVRFKIFNVKGNYHV